MRAPDVWQAMVAAMEASPTITGVVGDAIYLRPGGGIRRDTGSRDYEVPSITGLLIIGVQDERFAPCDFQLDVYARSMSDVVTVLTALFDMFDDDVRTTVGGLRTWTEFLEQRDIEGPDEDGVFHGSLDFRLSPIRRRYVRAAES